MPQEQYRKEWARFGYCRDEFPENDHFPYELYVRDARRMVSDYVITEATASRDGGDAPVSDPVAVAYWHTGLLTPTASDGSCAMGRLITRGLSSRTDINGDHLASRIGRWCLVELRARTSSPRLARVHRTWVTERYLFLLGLSFLGFIWKISYPCHGAQLTDTYSRPYTGAVRLEHQFYALGQACANACDIALLNSLAMQDVPYVALQERLLSQGVILDETSGGVPSFPEIRAQLISQSPD